MSEAAIKVLLAKMDYQVTEQSKSIVTFDAAAIATPGQIAFIEHIAQQA